jgi:hypothetical protein
MIHSTVSGIDALFICGEERTASHSEGEYFFWCTSKTHIALRCSQAESALIFTLAYSTASPTEALETIVTASPVVETSCEQSNVFTVFLKNFIIDSGVHPIGTVS